MAFAQVKHIKAALVAIIHEVLNENMYFANDFNVLFGLNLDGSKPSVFLERTSFNWLSVIISRPVPTVLSNI